MEDYEVPAALRPELDDLREQWGRAYVVTVRQDDSADEWTAQRRGDGTVLTASSGWELRTMMRRDYDGKVARHA